MRNPKMTNRVTFLFLACLISTPLACRLGSQSHSSGKPTIGEAATVSTFTAESVALSEVFDHYGVRLEWAPATSASLRRYRWSNAYGQAGGEARWSLDREFQITDAHNELVDTSVIPKGKYRYELSSTNTALDWQPVELDVKNDFSELLRKDWVEMDERNQNALFGNRIFIAPNRTIKQLGGELSIKGEDIFFENLSIEISNQFLPLVKWEEASMKQAASTPPILVVIAPRAHGKLRIKLGAMDSIPPVVAKVRIEILDPKDFELDIEQVGDLNLKPEVRVILANEQIPFDNRRLSFPSSQSATSAEPIFRNR